MVHRKIYHWSIISNDDDPYLAPELRPQCIQGVADSEDSGRWIRTSGIVGQRDGCVVTKSGSLYQLETVADGYEACYPDARNRLLNSLPMV